MEILTLEQVAKILNLRVSTIRKYCREGDMPCVKIGRTYRVEKRDLEKFLADRKRHTKSKDFREIWGD